MTSDQRTRAVVHNAADRALARHAAWVPLTVRIAIAATVLEALAEHGLVVVDREDLDIIVHRGGDLTLPWARYSDALTRLRAAVAVSAGERPAVAPTQTAPESTETGRESFPRVVGSPDESESPESPTALRERYAAPFRAAPGEERLGDRTPGEIADAVLAVRDDELERLRATQCTALCGDVERDRDVWQGRAERVRALANDWATLPPGATVTVERSKPIEWVSEEQTGQADRG